MTRLSKKTPKLAVRGGMSTGSVGGATVTVVREGRREELWYATMHRDWDWDWDGDGDGDGWKGWKGWTVEGCGGRGRWRQ